MIYWVRTVYYPNSAEQNLTLSRIKGLVASNVSVTLVYIRPNVNFDEVVELRYADVINLWSKPLLLASKESKLRHIQYVLFRIKSIRKFSVFCRSLSSDDVVIIEAGEEYYTSLFKSKAKIFLYRVEHPEAYTMQRIKYIQAFWIKKSRRFYKQADGVFVLTSGLKHFYLSEGVDEFKIHIINMAVDETRFDGIKKTHNVETYIGYCGSVSVHKDGVDDLIKAFALVHEQLPDVKLMIMGNFASRSDEKEIKNIIDQYNIRDFVTLTGLVQSNEIPQKLKDAAVLVLTRRKNLQTENGFPTKLAEYLLTGNPVVVTKTGDIPLFLEDGISAYLSEPGDIVQISQKMIKALTDGIMAKVVGNNGAEVARHSFNYKTESKKILNAIEK